MQLGEIVFGLVFAIGNSQLALFNGLSFVIYYNKYVTPIICIAISGMQ
jgi:hypothetical protein